MIRQHVPFLRVWVTLCSLALALGLLLALILAWSSGPSESLSDLIGNAPLVAGETP